MTSRNSTRRGRTRAPEPDFPAILGAFSDAHALISVSLLIIQDNEHSGPERISLRLGVEALDRAYNDLDGAINQLGEAP